MKSSIRKGRRPSAVLFGLLVLLCAALLVSCSGDDRVAVDLSERVDDLALKERLPPPDNAALRFGFEPRNNVQEDARQYVSFLVWLSKATGLRFELRFLPRSGNIVDEIGSGRIHFAAVGAGTFLRMQSRYGVIPLARGLNAEGKAEYKAAIVVPTGSTVRTIRDLRGRAFAFGGINSTQGHLIPRILLAEQGIGLRDLSRYEYTGSHRNCAAEVSAGHFDAGGVQDLLARHLEKAGILRILLTSRDYPSSGIVVAREVPEAVRERVRAALLDFRPGGKDASGLYHWDMTEMAGGFTPATGSDYAELGKWAREFGLLPPQPGSGPR